MGYKLGPDAAKAIDPHAFHIADDFGYFIDADLWTILDADTSGAVTHQGPGRGKVSVLASVDNEEAAIATTNELFKFVSGKAIVGEARVEHTIPNTDDLSTFVGFADALGADQIADDGASVAINDSGAAIYTLKDSLLYRFATNVGGGTVETSVSTTALKAGAATLRIDVIPISSTQFQARPFVDGVQLEDANGHKIAHTITLGTATDMDFGAYVKGHHANDAAILIDYLYAGQVR